MLRGLLSVRLKAAERAVQQGQLDDALRLIEQPDIAGHARSESLRAELAQALTERARQHYRAERFTEALIDLGKAQRCGGASQQIAELREQVMTVAQEVARQDADRRRRLDQARRCVDAGSLAAGKRLLQSLAEGDQDLAQIRKEIGDREKRADELLAQAERLHAEGRLDAAVDHLLRAAAHHAHTDRGLQLEAKITDTVLKQARNAFEAGLLKQARDELAALQSLGRRHPGYAELLETVESADAAGHALATGAFDEAQRRIHRLHTLAPKTAWVKRAVDAVQRLDAALLTLRGGPLGDVPGAQTENATVDLAETVALPHRAAGAGDAGDLPRALLLLVDGGGSYLLNRGDRVSIGRAATRDPADVPIFSDLSEHHADVARVEDDYFLLSGHDVEVGGRPTRHQLLHDGDRVVLARRAKFTLRIPDRKSATARLDLSDSTRVPNDVRRVILFRQTAMIGRGANCHVTCHAAQRDLILFERGGRLFVKPQGGGGPATPVVLGTPMEVAGASFVIQPWSVPTLGPSGRL